MKSENTTRKWKHPEGYKHLAPWTNAVLLRFLIRKITETLPHSESRRKDQLDDAGRSVISNIEEGFKRPTTREYLNFLGYSQGSLEEVRGLCRQAHQDGILKSIPGSSLKDIGIDLKELKGKLEEDKGNTPLEILYPPLASLKGSDLTFEMMLELCNKTDYLFRRLVESLEQSISKVDNLSPIERWRGQQIQNKQHKEKEFDEYLQGILRKSKEKREKGQ